MSELTPELQALLEDVLAGVRTAEDAEVQEAARGVPAFRAKLRELQEVVGLLDRIASDAQAVRRAAEESDSAPGEHALARTVLGARPERKQRSAVLWLGAAAAAAALAFLVARPLLVGRSGSGAHEPIPMGPKELQIVYPAATVERYSRFEWRGSLPPGAEFRIRIFDLTGASAGESPILQKYTKDTRWTPEPAELERLPDRIRVTVETTDPGSGAQASLDVRRSP